MSDLELSKNDMGSEILLPEILDLSLAENLHKLLGEALENAFAKQGSVTVNAAHVERLTTGPVQILLAAARACEARKSSFSIINTSEMFKSGIEDLGLTNIFAKWSEA